MKYTYRDDDRMASTTTPPPDEGLLAQTTALNYDTRGRRIHVVEPDGGQRFFEYNPDDTLARVHGSREYPFAFGFDDAGSRRWTEASVCRADYESGPANGYEFREVPRAIDVLGEAADNATVSVGGVPAVCGPLAGSVNYFYTPLPFGVDGSATWRGFRVSAETADGDRGMLLYETDRQAYVLNDGVNWVDLLVWARTGRKGRIGTGFGGDGTEGNSRSPRSGFNDGVGDAKAVGKIFLPTVREGMVNPSVLSLN